LASQNGHVEVVRLLLARKGVVVNKSEVDGATALHKAAVFGRAVINLRRHWTSWVSAMRAMPIIPEPMNADFERSLGFCPRVLMLEQGAL
jgi:hypothetical protein